MKNQKKILYSILTEIKNGNNRITESDYEITREEFANLIEYAENKQFINHSNVIRAGQGNIARSVILDNVNITIDGEDFLNENSSLAKIYKGLKEIKEFIF